MQMKKTHNKNLLMSPNEAHKISNSTLRITLQTFLILLTYAETPNTENPYNIGMLSNETLQSGINILNHVRYIAGLSDVALNDNYNKTAQAASVVIAADTTSILNHYPEKPSDMSNDIYQLGAIGAKSSNIAWGSWSTYTLNDSIVNGWMDDGDPGNISRLGHRRWILNPSMGATGFGVAVKTKHPIQELI